MQVERDVARILNNFQLTNHLTIDEIVAACDDNQMNCSKEMAESVVRIITNPEFIVGQRLTHTWTCESGEDQLYLGNILKIKRSKKFQIAYWSMEETEDESEDFDVEMKQIIADLLMGDLNFCF